jgi:pyruvate/2-oxoglutarate/acetoin dehydrogenase E1 component/TPP-dependent pyruvate/acetoin dehydrogenase alpha subunit
MAIKNKAKPKIEPALAKDMLEKMYLIRHFEQRVVKLFQQGLIRGATHVYLGEEAIAVGACAALGPDDYITSTHRGHGHVIARGLDVKRMLAELLGKATGYCGGKGGSMHIADIKRGILGANGVVGGGIPLSLGAGLKSVYKKTGQVTLCFFGDGAAQQGGFHESLNMAAIWKLPVVYICENNCFALTTPNCEECAIENIGDRAAAYGIPGYVIDGNDVISVYETVRKAVAHARAGNGPVLVECKTYRWYGHYLGDPEVYRTKEEVKEWLERDPIPRFVGELDAAGILSNEEAEKIDKDALAAVDEAEEFALASSPPAPETLTQGLWAPDKPLPEPVRKSDRMLELTYCQAINAGLREALAADSDVVILGEDVGLHGGPFQVTKGLFHEFGGERVRNTPLSEAAIAGCTVGAALTGLRPIGEIMYIDFTTIASDQIVNQAAKMRYMFGGEAKLPLVIRTMIGAGTRSSGQHSQSLEAWYCHIPGLKVVMPSTPYDAKGLIRSAIYDDNPVVFIELKRLYNTKGMVPDEEYFIPLGKADVKRSGRHVTVIATGAQVLEALKAAEELSSSGIEVEVVDPRTLYPLDRETIASSVRKTGRAVVVSDAIARFGICAEICAVLMEDAFDYLDAPVRRVGGAEVPMPYAGELEAIALPSAATIADAVREIL